MGDVRTGAASRINVHVGYRYKQLWLLLQKQTQSPAWMFELSTQERCEEFTGSVIGCDRVWQGRHGRVTMAGGGGT